MPPLLQVLFRDFTKNSYVYFTEALSYLRASALGRFTAESVRLSVGKAKVLVARTLPWPWSAGSLHTSGQYVVTDFIKSSTQCSGRHGGPAARLQESRDGAGVVAAPRTETETAVWSGRPRGRDRLAACRLALRGWGSSGRGSAMVGLKLDMNSFTPRMFYCHFFGFIESIMNLPRAETYWQDKSAGN